MSAASPTLSVSPTPEQHRLLNEAAAREHRSVSSFVLEAALHAAESVPEKKPKRTPEEVEAIFQAARAVIKAANPTNRDLLAELLAERREAAARGE